MKKMDLFQYRPWRILSRYEKCSGYWPYGPRTFLIKLYSAIIVTRLLATITKFVKSIGIDFLIVLECTIGIGIMTVILIKLVTPWANRHYKQQIYDKMRENFRSVKDFKEAQVLRNFYDKGWRFNTRYAVASLIITGLYQTSPIVNRYFNYFFNNVTMEKKLPVPVDYLVDQEKFFYPILLNIYLGAFVAILVEVAFNASFVLTIHHVCGLFEIVRMRVKKTVEYSNGTINDIGAIGTDDSIKAIIDLHNEALQLVVLMEKTYSIACFVILVVNSSVFGTNYFIILVHLNDGFQLFRYSLLFAMILSHFYFVFSQGQKLIDASLSVYDACCDCQWYTTPRKLQMSLYLILLQSRKSSYITGGNLFTLSMETYCKMLKTGLSFYTVYGSMNY